MNGELLKPVLEFLARNDSRVFIVLHTMGGHQNYAERYPLEFNRFGSHGIRMNSHVLHVAVSQEDATELTNSYDNSVLYTDWLLSQLIGILRETHAVASLYYVSDHGENSADASFMPFDHAAVSAAVLLHLTRSLASEKYEARKRVARDLTGEVFEVDERLGESAM